MIFDNLINAESIIDGCGVDIAEFNNIETCYVCNSFVRGGGNLCHECIGYVLIGLKWNCSRCGTFSDTKCFDHAPIRPMVFAPRNPDYDLREVDRINYNESSEDEDESVVVVVAAVDVDDGTMVEGNGDVDDEIMDEGNEDSDLDSDSEDGSVRGRIIENMNDGPFDYREEDESESDHEPDTRCRICFDANDPDYHNIVEERENGNWSAPYCRECNEERHKPNTRHCCGMWHVGECWNDHT